MKFLHLVLILLLQISFLASSCFEEPDKNDNGKRSENLYKKYENLLDKAAQEIPKKSFDPMRRRCDEWVMIWIKQALASIYNNKPFDPKVPDSGMGNIKDLEKEPMAVMKRFIEQEDSCSVQDYITRLEATLSESSSYAVDYTEQERKEVQDLLSNLKAMRSELIDKCINLKRCPKNVEKLVNKIVNENNKF